MMIIMKKWWYISMDKYEHINNLWRTFDIKSHCETIFKCWCWQVYSQYRYYLSWCESFDGCAMNRMIPCELIEGKRDRSVWIDPNKWVMSLNTFDKYGILLNVMLMYLLNITIISTIYILLWSKCWIFNWNMKYGKKNDMILWMKEMNQKKLICDFTLKKIY